jgi:hypothetical protein
VPFSTRTRPDRGPRLVTQISWPYNILKNKQLATGVGRAASSRRQGEPVL